MAYVDDLNPCGRSWRSESRRSATRPSPSARWRTAPRRWRSTCSRCCPATTDLRRNALRTAATLSNRPPVCRTDSRASRTPRNPTIVGRIRVCPGLFGLSRGFPATRNRSGRSGITRGMIQPRTEPGGGRPRAAAPATASPLHFAGLHRPGAGHDGGGHRAVGGSFGRGEPVAGPDDGAPQSVACLRRRAGAAAMACRPDHAVPGDATARLRPGRLVPVVASRRTPRATVRP